MNIVRRGLLHIVTVASLAVGAGPASAEIVVNQQPTQLGGYGSDTETIDSFGTPVWAREADNIRLSQTATIHSLSWWGFYGGDEQNHNPPSGPETMRIRFLNARAGDGLPDDSDILFEQSFVNLPRVPTGLTIAVQGGPVEYYYQTDLERDVSLFADATYWLEIVQVGDPLSHFRWETGFGSVSGHAVITNSIDDWHSSSGSFAFQLFTIPEPMTLSYVVFALGLISARRAPRRTPGVSEKR